MSEERKEKTYPEDERLRQFQEDPDRRMTRAEWEREESHARQAAHQRHERAKREKEPDHESVHASKKATGHKKKPLDKRKAALWIGGGLLVLLIIFLVGFLPRHNEEKKAAEAAKKRETEEPEVEVVQVKRSHKTGELTVPGTTAALVEAYVYARANGYLKKRYVDIGDHVKKGQLLALIDAPDLDQQVEQAHQQLNQAEAQLSQQQAQLALNKVTWDRWRVLVAKGVFSRQDGDQREAQYETQRALVASADRNVESFRANLNRVIALQSYERVTAPFDGVITQRNTDIGALVGSAGAASGPPMVSPDTPSSGSANVGSGNTSGSSGTPNQLGSPSTGLAQGGALFALAQFNTLRILVSVPESYANSIHQGMHAQVYTQERVGKPIPALVTRTANAIDQNSRTMLVEVDINNKTGSLYPGIYSIVTFVQVRGIPPITIPGDAVVVRNDRTTVAVVRDNKVSLVPVEIGRDYGPAIEILSGLHEGDWVVSTVTDSVQPGIKVRSRPNEEVAKQASGSEDDSNGTPDFGPSQYGDQSVVNSKSESTNQTGKPGQKKGGDQQKSGGKQKGSDKKDASK
ncbi:efflux RND transporter periplasmic adaptor subunit [Acidicapsa ligni]|uniref:efflux RND transporter periplasmic adaptor subunit n=1 Tax=Acidicapsa ligni TaxID=542300 RepID=UPI0021E05D47|nr:efflux RND transporter periplasmic adaptor subunit [Acidicapsa ligni]